MIERTHVGQTIRDKVENEDYVVLAVYPFFVKTRKIHHTEVLNEEYRCFSLGDLVTMGYEPSGWNGIPLRPRKGW